MNSFSQVINTVLQVRFVIFLGCQITEIGILPKLIDFRVFRENMRAKFCSFSFEPAHFID